MRVIKTKVDKYLIECIEIDLYDLLYRFSLGQIVSTNNVSNLLNKYKYNGAIKDFYIIECKSDLIVVVVFVPKKVKIRCKAP